MNVELHEREGAPSARQAPASENAAKDRPLASGAWRPSTKIRDRHWERLAIVYVRQSSPHQVLENRESRERQYALVQVAQQLGWPADRVLVIDDDQGISGKSSEKRQGFQRLLTEVTLGHAGLVLGLELSRLARSCKDWHHLVEVCAVFDTLLYDQDGVYDANDSNDRLLLGMKGAMSEYELITLRNRLERGRSNKAARGELFLHVPIGYIKSPSGQILQEPDEQARGVVQLVFEKFEELGTAWRVFRYLRQNRMQLGFRALRGSTRGQLEWRRPMLTRILAMLRHPIYAGVYAYGLHRPGRKNPVTGRVEGGKWFLGPDEIRVLIPGRVPAYIGWEQYLANQRRLSANRSFPGALGTDRAGRALLSGLIVCGRCGHRMNVAYQPQGKKDPHYWCDTHLLEERHQRCFGLKAPPVDELVAQQVLRALEPAAVELSLQAAADIQRERERLHQHWRQSLERAQYESQRAQRQYQCVEPENRLVARTLEQRWEESLRQQRQIREEYDRFLTTTPTTLSQSDTQRIREASQNIAALWHAAQTTPQDRKAIVRCLVDRVVVHVEQRSEHVDVTIHWHGGFTSQHEVVRPVGCYSQMRDYDVLIKRIDVLHQVKRASSNGRADHAVKNVPAFGLIRLSDQAFARDLDAFAECHGPPLFGTWVIGGIVKKVKGASAGHDRARAADKLAGRAVETHVGTADRRLRLVVSKRQHAVERHAAVHIEEAARLDRDRGISHDALQVARANDEAVVACGCDGPVSNPSVKQQTPGTHPLIHVER